MNPSRMIHQSNILMNMRLVTISNIQQDIFQINTHLCASKYLPICQKSDDKFKIEDWQINNKTAQKTGLSVTSTIDYYPFPVTYPSEQKSKSGSKSKSSAYPRPWQVIEHKYALQMGYNFTDSIDDKVPVLTRKYIKHKIRDCDLP